MPRLSTLVRKPIKWIPDKPIVSAFSLFFLLAEEGDPLCFGEVLPPGPCFKFKALGVAALVWISRAGGKAGSLCS